MSKCACDTTDTDRPHRTWMEILGSVGLQEVGQQTLDLRPVVESSLKNLRKAERAEALGLGAEVAALHRRAAERDNRQALRLVRAAQEGLRNRTAQEDWQDRASALDEAFGAQDGASALQDMRERWVETMYETDLDAGDSREAVEIFDKAVSASREGVASLIRWFDDQLTQAGEALSSPTMGRNPHPPLTDNQAACLAVVAANTTIATIVCFATPFCWCCYGWVIALAAAAATAACLTGVR